MIPLSFTINQENEKNIINSSYAFTKANTPKIVHSFNTSKNISLRPATLTNFDNGKISFNDSSSQHTTLNSRTTKKNIVVNVYKKTKKQKTINSVSVNSTEALLEKKVTSSKQQIKQVALLKKSKNKKYTSKKNSINISEELRKLQTTLDDIALDELENLASPRSSIASNSVTTDDYWKTVHSIESKQGKLLYRPKNKARNCTYTLGPCGHYQLTVQALKDIGCVSLQCRKDRLNLHKSLKQSKQLLALNERRLKKFGLSNLKGHERYLIHQQGANGIKNIIAATKGNKKLSSTIKKNMANNSPYSYKQFKHMGSKNAANKFMQHWKHKWAKEQRLVLTLASNSTDNLINTRVPPSFNDNDLNFALNMQF